MTDSYNSAFYQTSIRKRKLQGFYGSLAANTPQNDLERNYVNRDPQASQVDTLTISSAATATFTYNGIAYTVTTGSGTAAGDAALVEAYILAEGAIYGDVDVSRASNVITLTAKNPGFTYTITSGAAAAAASVTAAADASAVAFGRAVVRAGFPTGGLLSVDDTMEAGRVADTSAFTPQVDTWTVPAGLPGLGQFIGASIKIVDLDNGDIEERVPWDTDLDTTLDNLAVVLNAALTDIGANIYVTVAGPGGAPGAGELEFTAAFAGPEFDTMVTCDDAAGYPAITVASNKAWGTSFSRSFAGMSKRGAQEATATDPSAASYPANSQMLIVERGDCYVQNSEALASYGQVFVDLTAGAGAGRFYGAAAASRVPISRKRAEWMYSGRTNYSDALGVLRLK